MQGTAQDAPGATASAFTRAGRAGQKPSSVVELVKLAVSVHKEGRLNEAAAIYDDVLRAEPEHAEALHNLGMIAYENDNVELAIQLISKAVERSPRDAMFVLNLGKALQRRGDFAGAAARFRESVALGPGFEEAHYQLGNALMKQGHYVEAAVHFSRVIAITPDSYKAVFALALALHKGARLEQAITCYRKVIAMEPGYAPAHNNLGTAFVEQDRFEAAVACFEAALAADPLLTAALSNTLYLHALLRDIPVEEERKLAEGWEKLVLNNAARLDARHRAAAGSGYFPVKSIGGGTLRVGIVSGDLGNHPVSEFVEPFLQQIDRSRFHITLFPTILRAGARAERLQHLADSFISLIYVSDEAAVERIKSEKIDILIDASGHTTGGRLGIFARRAAPVQCSYVGYWSTTGLTEMDWYITDTYCPPAIDAHFTEGLWRLPRLAYCYPGDPSLPEGGWTPDPDGTVWLGSFNKFAKIREQTLALWAAVLHAIPEAKLLFEDRLPDETTNHRRILSTLATLGIGAERIAFIPYIDGHERHMMMYDRLDIALDTIPFNSGSTAYDALWMGLPLVTLEGDWLGGILTSSVLKAFGREDWIAANTEEYISIVSSLARDVGGRTALRRNQRALMAASPLCDAKSLTRTFEAAFEAMYTRWLGTRAG